ncbi:hypothetical protein TKK_0005416 [Trichogramma kaykai]|uniref:Uncharacterized protein n=1 Tax=Trichogramma kaykai TaxID=54128 RepID=A0ABD2XII6_9HYME
MSSEDESKMKTRGDGPTNVIYKGKQYKLGRPIVFITKRLETFLTEEPRLWPDYHEWVREHIIKTKKSGKWEKHKKELETRQDLIKKYNKETHYQVNKDVIVGLMNGNRNSMKKVFQAMNLLPLPKE